jgi:4-amino-4-deoxy-L-arabinose transferase-like glycosyltransferase
MGPVAASIMPEAKTSPRPVLFPRLERWGLPLVLGMAALRLVMAALVPLSPDESYYWLWTRPVQLSYLDHPGMVGWWIWAGVRLLGDTALGVRLFSVVAAALATALIWDAGRTAWGSREAGARSAIWLNSTILFNAAGVLMTPDAPLLLFWTLCLWALIHLADDGRARWLYVAAIACGLGAISKYSMGLIVPGALVTFLAFSTLRRWLASVHFWVAAGLGLLCTAPLVIWNREHGWASIAKQFGHAFASGVHNPVSGLIGFLGSQLGLVTPLLMIVTLWSAGWTLTAGWRQRQPAWFLLGAVSLPIVLFFALHSLDNVVQAHWAGPAYIGCAIAGAGAPHVGRIPRKGWQWLMVAAPALGLAMTLIVFFQAATALLPVPPITDPTKRLAGWDTLAQATQEARAAHPEAFLFAAKHEVAGILSFRLADHPNVFLIGNAMRPSFYGADAVARLRGHDGILVSGIKEDDPHYLDSYFERLTPLAEVTLLWGGRVADRYRLTLAEGYKGGLFVEGDGYPGRMDNQ